MAKAKTRVGVMLDGHLRELFSVRELNNGDLLIILKTAAKFEQAPTSQPISCQRYSVHRSQNSDPPGRLLKQTVRLEDGTQIETAQFRHLVEGRFLALIFSRACPSLEPDRYRMKPHQRDRVVSLYEGDIGYATLFYTIIVDDGSTDLRSFGETNLRATRISFEHFDIVVMSGFFMVPAIGEGDLIHLMTSMPALNGERPQPLEMASLDSLEPSEACALVQAITADLAHRTTERRRSMMFLEGGGPDAETLRMIAAASGHYCAIPPHQLKQAKG